MYQIDQATGDIVISGFENGIGDSPYTGLTDLRNANISSIPSEASINFSTVSKTPAQVTGTVTSAFTTGATGINYSGGTGLENGMCISFTNLSNTTLGITNNTPYWVINLGVGGAGKFGLASDYERTTSITLTGTVLTGSFSTYNIATPKYIVLGMPITNYTQVSFVYYMVDSSGQVWSNKQITTSGAWTFTGNTGTTNGANGNGLVYYGTSDTTIGYLFVFRGSGIDYTKVNPSSPSSLAISWVYGWNPKTGVTGTPGATPVLKSGITSGNSHESWVMPDGEVYFCDGPNVGKFFQTDLVTPTTFDPTDTTTYTYTTYPVLPLNDVSQCLAPLGTSILIGGASNVIYTWNTIANQIDHPLLLAESNVQKMVTVNTNTYAFVGNRGRIYITNGSQAELYKKIPDHVSDVVEPYFTWGGATVIKKRLFFGVSATDNAGTRIPNYGGVWSIDTSTGALMLANRLSYGTYEGLASAILGEPSNNALIPAYPTGNPTGLGYVVGWDNTFYGSANGIDVTQSTIYTAGETYVISDAIPIGTLLKPSTPSQFEFKLATPLLSGESVQLLIAPYQNSGTTPTFTSVLTINGDGTLLSGNSQSTSLQKIQWLMVKAILTGKSSSPSYNRLKELRIIGAGQR